jgi:hypothetical protein
MPGPALHVGAGMTCPHGAPIQVVTSNARVVVSGTPAATFADTFPIVGCPFQVPIGTGTKPQPCVRVQWLVPAVRVLINGQPALMATSTGLCLSAEGIPQGAPVVSVTQPRTVVS